MRETTFKVYENESDTFCIDNLTIENRLDRLSLYGSVDITKDRQGLEYALSLKKIIDDSVHLLLRESHLPEHVAIHPLESVENPF